VKRHVVGKKCTRQYAADSVLASFRDAIELLYLKLHQNTSWRVETQSSTDILMKQNASIGGYCQVWDMTGTWLGSSHVSYCRYETWLGSNRAWNNHFLKELSTHNCSESSCKQSSCFQDCSLPQNKAPENLRMTAGRKFRPSVNLDEYDSLQGSSELLQVWLCEQIFDKTIPLYVGMLG